MMLYTFGRHEMYSSKGNDYDNDPAYGIRTDTPKHIRRVYVDMGLLFTRISLSLCRFA